MNKFMKGCLLTALVMLIVGCVVSGVCWLLGGYRNPSHGLVDLPFLSYSGDGRHWSIGFRDHESEFGKDWEKERYLQIKDGENVSCSASSIRELDLELGACTLYLQESADDQIHISVEGKTLRYYYLADGDTLRVKNAGRTKVSRINDKMYLSVPADFVFDEADVTLGAGKMEGGALRTGKLTMDVGAGECSLQEISGNEISMNLGAGRIKTQMLDAAELSLQVGAGEYDLNGVNVTRDLDLELGMGNADIVGAVTGDLNVDCGMGNVAMHLAGSEDDHAYEVDCGMGNVEIGGRSYGGFSSEQKWNSGQASIFEIECNMGNVKISFEE